MTEAKPAGLFAKDRVAQGFVANRQFASNKIANGLSDFWDSGRPPGGQELARPSGDGP